jgi:MoaA/NifB/PqqE/SkfB family radical SAM enzyme
MDLGVREAIRRHAIERVVVSGGEPMLVPNLLDLVRLIDSLGVRPSLCSNATLIGGSAARSLALAGLKSCTVGVDGAREEYERFRGSGAGSYDRALRGISCLAGAGVSVTVNVSVHNSVLGRAARLARDLRGRGLTSLSITSPIIQGRLGSTHPAFTDVSWGAVHRFANEFADLIDCPVSLRTPRCDRPSCPSGISVFALTEQGLITSCPDVGAENVADHHAMTVAAAIDS